MSFIFVYMRDEENWEREKNY